MNKPAILLIEDEENFRRSLRVALEKMGFSVTEAEEGEAGLRLYRTGLFDLVITDLVMPGKEGLETIRELRAFDPKARIIAVSGGGRVDPGDYLPMARAFGAAEVLCKPFDHDLLTQTIRSVLGNNPE